MTPEIPLWSGSSLDNAECLNYVKAVATKVNELDPDALRVRRQIGLLDELIPRFADFVNEGRGSVSVRQVSFKVESGQGFVVFPGV